MLLLFDVDGTLLLKATAAHAAAVHEALREVYGIGDLSAVRVEAAGRTDYEIGRAICLQLGISADRFDAGREDFRIACVAAYARLCPDDLSEFVAPGVTDVLEALAARDDTRLALLTGNLEPIARLKIGRAGLGRFFEPGQGGFGSDHEDRTELPAIARRRAGRYPRARTVVIGDTPRDIACARADGVRCIAVATGPYGPEDLADADVVLRSAHELLDAL
ncbi:MAG TPA: haloacid dehalogenase-like hydrolase [Solirubrobacteraceae bacterium]|nr:haloacid dehalogenase-like hydrolase [Solirubrobacteraceae bacterium]